MYTLAKIASGTELNFPCSNNSERSISPDFIVQIKKQ